jgi:hypothetical protein
MNRPLLVDSDEEKRQREREARHRDERPQTKKTNYQLDIIDEMDVTSIYGMGGKLCPLNSVRIEVG